MEHNFSKDSLELLYEISRELVSSLDFNLVLSRVLELSVHNVGAERGVLIVLDEALNPIQAVIVYQGQLMQYGEEDMRAILDAGMAGWVFRNRQAVLIEDTSKDERWMHRPDDDPNRSGSKSAICVPIQLTGDGIAGILTIVHPATGFFNSGHFELIKAIAEQAGIAIHNARLYRSLESAQKRYHELFDDNIDPILITDWNGRVMEANRVASQTMGLPDRTFSQRTIADVHSVNWEAVGHNFDNLRTSSATFTYQSEVHLEDKKLPVEVYVRKVDLDEGTLLQWILRDVSERKTLEEMRESLMATIYHDLRSPLSNVISSLDLIKSSVSTEDDIEMGRLIDIALRSAERVQRLTGSLLDVYQLEAGQPVENRKKVEVSHIVGSALEAVAVNAEAKQMRITQQIPSGLKRLCVDEDMIQRVLINLLDNAVKYTHAYGRIELGAAAQDDFIKIWVKDNGPGIPAKSRESIFEKFSRLQTGSKMKGIGLGLAFCRLAVEAHGGEIWVDSTEGEGSCFQMTLPVAND